MFSSSVHPVVVFLLAGLHILLSAVYMTVHFKAQTNLTYIRNVRKSEIFSYLSTDSTENGSKEATDSEQKKRSNISKMAFIEMINEENLTTKVAEIRIDI
jgi:hypothetical protein